MSEDKTIETDVKQEQADTKVENNVPISRLNEVITERNDLRESLESFKSKEEDDRRAKLREEEKWQELNADLANEIESYKPFKAKWESMDAKLREVALSKLPESKREKFSNVDTEVLLDIVKNFQNKKKQILQTERVQSQLKRLEIGQICLARVGDRIGSRYWIHT